MIYVSRIIFEAHLYMVVIVLSSYVFEKMFGFKLLIDNFNWKKSDYQAAGSSDVLSLLYFVVSLIVLLYNVYGRKSAPADYAFWKWLIIIIPLTVLFRVWYNKNQGRDPTKKNSHHD